MALRRMTLPPRPRDYVPGEYHFERLNKCEKKIPVVTFRCRRYRIILFLVFVYQLAVLDELNLLPTGLLMLHVGITITIEEFAKEFQRQHELEEAFLQERILSAKFEYHVLRGDPQAQIVSRLEADGSTKLYAI